jgi:predicted secreted protein
MPDPTFIPGYLGTVTLNADNISAIGSVVSLKKTRNVMTKPTFGNEWGFSLGGQKIGAFSASGHVSAEQAADLEAIFASNAPIAFSLQVGEGSAATDAGLHTGNCVVSDYTIEANADGEWDWSIDAQTSGALIYTPASPGS